MYSSILQIFLFFYIIQRRIETKQNVIQCHTCSNCLSVLGTILFLQNTLFWIFSVPPIKVSSLLWAIGSGIINVQLVSFDCTERKSIWHVLNDVEYSISAPDKLKWSSTSWRKPCINVALMSLLRIIIWRVYQYSNVVRLKPFPNKHFRTHLTLSLTFLALIFTNNWRPLIRICHQIAAQPNMKCISSSGRLVLNFHVSLTWPR